MNPTIDRETQNQRHNELVATLKALVEKVESLEKEITKLTKKQSPKE